MENDPFNTSKPESDSSAESDSDLSSKKKKKFRKLPLFSGSQESASETSESKPKILEAPESLWNKLVGSPAEEKSAQTSDKTEAAEIASELSDTDTEVLPDGEQAIEELSLEEQAEITERYIQTRLELLESEQAKQADDPESNPAEQAADIALLLAIRNRLQLDRESSIAEHVEEAYTYTANTIVPGSDALPPSAEAPAVLANDPTPSPRYASSEAEPYAAPKPVERTSVKTVEKPTNDIYENRTGSALLVGGAVGYLIGRRRGRIKTEKQMATLEKKMTTKVESLERIISVKEEQIRQVVREKVPKLAARSIETASKPYIPAKEMLGVVSLKAIEATTATTATTTVERTPKKTIEKTEKLIDRKPMPEKKTSVLTMSRAEVIEISESIPVGATNLRRVYETNLISENSLRRLIDAKSRGADIRKMLEQEMIEKEMSFERDPRLRNSSAVGTLAAGAVVKVLNDSGLADSVKQKVDARNKKQNSATDVSLSGNFKAHQPVAAYVTVLTLSVVIVILLYLLFTSN
jgi:hypothetical protein